MPMNWKNFLHYTRAETIAILIVLVIIVLTFILNIVLSTRSTQSFSIPQNDSLIAAFERLQNSLTDKRPASENFAYSPKERRETAVYSEKRKVEAKEFTTNNPGERREYIEYERQEKLSDSEFIYLNETDTTLWKKVPGIGSTYAARIVKYRNLLGGFTSVEQLKEVYGISDEVFQQIAPFLREDTNFLKLNINKLTFQEINAHPYINYKQTKAIMNLRNRKGNIQSINELSMLDEFTRKDIDRIANYIEF